MLNSFKIWVYLFIFQGDISEFYPSELEFLKGIKLLLKVEKSNTDDSNFPENAIKVEKLCSDLSLIDAFDSVRYFYLILYLIFFIILYFVYL
jgi:hypothetical protein